MTRESSDEDAQRIADRGRDALLERLRPAFQATARQHADILQLEDAQLEEMIQRAADQADGLQWRRALASVATEELGMSLGEALSSPVVARAQELAGAPSYEEALAGLGLEPAAAPNTNGDGAPPESLEVPGESPETTDGPAAAGESGPADELDEEPDHVDELGQEPHHVDEDEVGDDAAPEPLRLSATHLGGIATLEAGEPNLELRLGAHGLDIARKPGRVLGRLRWREIRTLEVQPPRGLRRRRRADHAHLVIRTRHGDASFEVPEITDEELEASLAPLLERYAPR